MGQNESHLGAKHPYDPLQWTEKDQQVQMLTLENAKLQSQLKETSRQIDMIPRLQKKLQHTRGLLELQRNENQNNVRRNTDLLSEIEDLRTEIILKTKENQEKYKESEVLHAKMQKWLKKIMRWKKN